MYRFVSTEKDHILLQQKLGQYNICLLTYANKPIFFVIPKNQLDIWCFLDWVLVFNDNEMIKVSYLNPFVFQIERFCKEIEFLEGRIKQIQDVCVKSS